MCSPLSAVPTRRLTQHYSLEWQGKRGRRKTAAFLLVGWIQGGDPLGSRGTTSSGAFDISALRPATGLGLERREASAAPKKAQEGEGSEFLGA